MHKVKIMLQDIKETIKMHTESHDNQQLHNTINGRSIVDIESRTGATLSESIDHFIRSLILA